MSPRRSQAPRRPPPLERTTRGDTYTVEVAIRPPPALLGGVEHLRTVPDDPADQDDVAVGVDVVVFGVDVCFCGPRKKELSSADLILIGNASNPFQQKRKPKKKKKTSIFLQRRVGGHIIYAPRGTRKKKKKKLKKGNPLEEHDVE